MGFRVIQGDVLEIARSLELGSFDGCLCDPPYGLSFMGKRWDYDVPSVETWAAVLGALKPGGHLLAFAGTRTQHRMAVRIEDAGFEIRDMIAWVYGSGFPKSLDVSKAIDKAAGAERTEGGRNWSGGARSGGISHGGEQSGTEGRMIYDTPATDAARQWSGYGTALKPALEPITVARKPLRGTVAANCLEYGTGAINVDATRIGFANDADRAAAFPGGKLTSHGKGRLAGPGSAQDVDRSGFVAERNQQGRWPANLIHDGSEEVLALAGDSARFFYCAKASRSEREAGLDAHELRTKRILSGGIPSAVNSDPRGMSGGGDRRARNNHPTVKPLALAEYLARLILPPKRPDGKPRRLLVPFSGSGSEMIGALKAGWDEVVGIEISTEYIEIAEARLEKWIGRKKKADPSYFEESYDGL